MKASLVIDYHLNNKIFDIEDENVNRDNYANSIWLLKQELMKIGFDLQTCDINDPEESELVLYFDYPKTGVCKTKGLSYLFLFENEIIKPEGWETQKHASFNRVFSWNDDYVRSCGYTKFNYTHLFPTKEEFNEINSIGFSDKKLCTLISANKLVDHPKELYSKRIDIIKWFETNKPEDFDLYGIGWDGYVNDGSLLSRVMKKIPVISKAYSYHSYKGTVRSKKEVLRKYKYAICFENALDYPGYITEKIFDCLFSGCVPVYLGAPNIGEYIPKGCYVDMRDFESYDEVYDYLMNVTDCEYEKYISAIKDYLFTQKSNDFRSIKFSEIIISSLNEDLRKINDKG